MRVLGSSDLKFRSQIIIELENERIFDESKWKIYFNNQILVNFKRTDGNAVEIFFDLIYWECNLMITILKSTSV